MADHLRPEENEGAAPELEALAELYYAGNIGQANALYGRWLCALDKRLPSLSPESRRDMLRALQELGRRQKEEDWVAMGDGVKHLLLPLWNNR